MKDKLHNNCSNNKSEQILIVKVPDEWKTIFKQKPYSLIADNSELTEEC